jgi:hypothetical protein
MTSIMWSHIYGERALFEAAHIATFEAAHKVAHNRLFEIHIMWYVTHNDQLNIHMFTAVRQLILPASHNVSHNMWSHIMTSIMWSHIYGERALFEAAQIATFEAAHKVAHNRLFGIHIMWYVTHNDKLNIMWLLLRAAHNKKLTLCVHKLAHNRYLIVMWLHIMAAHNKKFTLCVHKLAHNRYLIVIWSICDFT